MKPNQMIYANADEEEYDSEDDQYGGEQEDEEQGEGGGEQDIILLEQDPDYNPTPEEIEEFAEYLGFQLPEDNEFLNIARQGLIEPLPEGWCLAQVQNDDQTYYFNTETQQLHEESPNDAVFAEKYQQAKKMREIAKSRSAPQTAATSKKRSKLHNLIVEYADSNNEGNEEPTKNSIPPLIPTKPSQGLAPLTDNTAAEKPKQSQFLKEQHSILSQQRVDSLPKIPTTNSITESKKTIEIKSGSPSIVAMNNNSIPAISNIGKVRVAAETFNQSSDGPTRQRAAVEDESEVVESGAHSSEVSEYSHSVSQSFRERHEDYTPSASIHAPAIDNNSNFQSLDKQSSHSQQLSQSHVMNQSQQQQQQQQQHSQQQQVRQMHNQKKEESAWNEETPKRDLEERQKALNIIEGGNSEHFQMELTSPGQSLRHPTFNNTAQHTLNFSYSKKGDDDESQQDGGIEERNSESHSAAFQGEERKRYAVVPGDVQKFKGDDDELRHQIDEELNLEDEEYLREYAQELENDYEQQWEWQSQALLENQAQLNANIRRIIEGGSDQVEEIERNAGIRMNRLKKQIRERVLAEDDASFGGGDLSSQLRQASEGYTEKIKNDIERQLAETDKKYEEKYRVKWRMGQEMIKNYQSILANNEIINAEKKKELVRRFEGEVQGVLQLRCDNDHEGVLASMESSFLKEKEVFANNLEREIHRAKQVCMC